MTSTDLKVADGPLEVVRRLSMRSMIVALALAVAALAYSAAPVFAEETTTTTSTTSSVTTSTESSTSTTETGYNQTPEVPKEKVPKNGVAPSKEKVSPKHPVEPKPKPEPEAHLEVVVPAEPVEPTETLPFTGYDLRWVVGGGFLLIAGGALSLLAIRRRERHSSR